MQSELTVIGANAGNAKCANVKTYRVTSSVK